MCILRLPVVSYLCASVARDMRGTLSRVLRPQFCCARDAERKGESFFLLPRASSSRSYDASCLAAAWWWCKHSRTTRRSCRSRDPAQLPRRGDRGGRRNFELLGMPGGRGHRPHPACAVELQLYSALQLYSSTASTLYSTLHHPSVCIELPRAVYCTALPRL